MSWTTIILLHLVLCSVMMFLCRKGENKKKKQKVSGKNTPVEQISTSKSELQSLQIRMAEMMEHNQELKKEYESLKESKPQ